MGMVSGLNASYEKEISIQDIEEGQCEFGRDGDKLLNAEIVQMKAQINRMTVSLELAYWVKILDAYEKTNVRELVRLQNEERPKNNFDIQMKTVFFILSAIDQEELNNKKKTMPNEPCVVALPSMAQIKQNSSLFQRITADK